MRNWRAWPSVRRRGSGGRGSICPVGFVRPVPRGASGCRFPAERGRQCPPRGGPQFIAAERITSRAAWRSTISESVTPRRGFQARYGFQARLLRGEISLRPDHCIPPYPAESAISASSRLLRGEISLHPAAPSARLCGGKEEKDHGGEIGNGGADDRGGRADCGNRNGSDIRAGGRADAGGCGGGAAGGGGHGVGGLGGGAGEFPRVGRAQLLQRAGGADRECLVARAGELDDAVPESGPRGARREARRLWYAARPCARLSPRAGRRPRRRSGSAASRRTWSATWTTASASARTARLSGATAA